MNVCLWVVQGVVAFFCISGAAWRYSNYATAKDIASLQALSFGAWNAIGAFEVVCALLLILPAFFKWSPKITPIAATCLAVELLLVTALHVHYFGFELKAANPGTWSFGLAVLSAFIAYGRFQMIQR